MGIHLRRRCALARIDTSTSSARDFAPVAVEARAHVQVQRFFGTKHNDKFLIFNLCQVPPLCAAERLVSHPRVASAHAPRQVHPLATRICVLRKHTLARGRRAGAGLRQAALRRPRRAHTGHGPSRRERHQGSRSLCPRPEWGRASGRFLVSRHLRGTPETAGVTVLSSGPMQA